MSVRPTGQRQSRLVPTTPYSPRITTRKVYVGNLPYDLQWQELKDHMKQAGTVVKADIITDPDTGRSKGYGIVEFATIQEAEHAINTLKSTTLMGRTINVREDREDPHRPISGSSLSVSSTYPSNLAAPRTVGRRVYIGNLSFDVTWQDLIDFLKNVGNVTNVDILQDSSGRSKGCAIAEFVSSEDALNAITMLNERELKGRKIFIREDREEGRTASAHIGMGPPHYYHQPMYPYPYGAPIMYGHPMHQYPPQYGVMSPSNVGMGSDSGDGIRHIGRRLYVSNLAWDVSWQDLKDHFKAVVPVLHVEVFTAKDGRSRGCGIVEFMKPDDAIIAIGQLNNSILKGRPIFVREDRDEGKSS